MPRVGDKKSKMYESALRDFALTFPEAYEEFPWGDRAIKVSKKMFICMGHDPKTHEFGFSVKLPLSRASALEYAFTEPTGYGLGKSGWVSARLGPDHDVPIDLLKEWITESYRAIAPKKLVAALDSPPAKPTKKSRSKSTQ